MRVLPFLFLLLSCSSPVESREEGLELGYNQTEEWGLVFWACTSPPDTIYFSLSWSWGRIEGKGKEAVAIKSPTTLENVWWKVWTTSLPPDSIQWRADPGVIE